MIATVNPPTVVPCQDSATQFPVWMDTMAGPMTAAAHPVVMRSAM